MYVKGVVVDKIKTENGFAIFLFDGKTVQVVNVDRLPRSRFVEVNEGKIKEMSWEILEELYEKYSSQFELNLPEDLIHMYPSYTSVKKLLNFHRAASLDVNVTFDFDADGIVSAMILSTTVKVRPEPLQYYQIDTGDSLPVKPSFIHVFLDMGSSLKFGWGLKIIKKYVKNVVVIDHHPLNKIVEGLTYINSYPSETYCTSCLVYYLVDDDRRKEVEHLLRIGAAGDRSSCAEWNNTDRKKALSLELYASITHSTALERYKELLEGDWQFYYEIYRERIEYIDSISYKEEIEIGDKKLLFVQYPYPGFRYPHRGKVASYYQEQTGADVVVVEEEIVEKRKRVSVRSTFDMYDLLESISKEGIGEGYGHPKAFSFSINSSQPVKDLILKFITEKLN